jgi:hypothetical protein
MMAFKESSATALVRFTGLGIICFNKDLCRGEIAAMRDHKHLLNIKIQQPVFHDGSGNDLITYRDLATYRQLPKENVQIDIKAQGKAAIEGYEIYQNGNFDRLHSADVNDFNWIVNMNALHGNAAPGPNVERHPDRYPVTKIYIGNGLFYTHKLDTNLFFEKVETDASGTVTQREIFGNVAETIGVKIEGEEVNFTIRIGDKEETHLLKRVAGLPFRIEISNMDYNADAVYSDMPDYYLYLPSPNGRRFDLTPIVEDAGGDSVNQKSFCHPLASDSPSINQL